MSTVELFDVLADLWPKEELYGFYYRPIKSLSNNASTNNTNNTHISPTTARTPKPASPMCSFLLMRSRGYALCCDFQCIHVFSRRWNVALNRFESLKVHVCLHRSMAISRRTNQPTKQAYEATCEEPADTYQATQAPIHA